MKSKPSLKRPRSRSKYSLGSDSDSDTNSDSSSGSNDVQPPTPGRNPPSSPEAMGPPRPVPVGIHAARRPTLKPRKEGPALKAENQRSLPPLKTSDDYDHKGGYAQLLPPIPKRQKPNTINDRGFLASSNSEINQAKKALLDRLLAPTARPRGDIKRSWTPGARTAYQAPPMYSNPNTQRNAERSSAMPLSSPRGSIESSFGPSGYGGDQSSMARTGQGYDSFSTPQRSGTRSRLLLSPENLPSPSESIATPDTASTASRSRSSPYSDSPAQQVRSSGYNLRAANPGINYKDASSVTTIDKRRDSAGYSPSAESSINTTNTQRQGFGQRPALRRPLWDTGDDTESTSGTRIQTPPQRPVRAGSRLNLGAYKGSSEFSSPGTRGSTYRPDK